jgi:MSHA biogenesis protein MshM
MMYERHWRLQHSPFDDSRRAESYFAGSSHQNALLKMRLLIGRHLGAGLIVGQSGTGKTRLLHSLLSGDEFADAPQVKIVYPMLSPFELVSDITSQLSGESTTAMPTSMDAVLRMLAARLQTLTTGGRAPVIVIDDAHAIPDRHVFQSLHLLLNLREPGRIDFTLILSGQPELAGIVRRLPEFGDRVTIPCILTALTADETADYVRHRLRAAGATESIFHNSALVAIHELSGGLPRRINRLCDFAMLVGFAKGLRLIDADHIEGVHAELNLTRAA